MSGYFNELPDNIRLPFAYAEFDASQADRSLATMAFNVLLTGQQFVGESLAEPYVPRLISSSEQADRLFGRGSMLAEMCRAYMTANVVTKLTALGVPDYASGVQATAKLEFAVGVNGVTVATPICLYIGGLLVRAGVALGMNQQAVCEAVAAAINAESRAPALAEVLTTGDDPNYSYSVVLTAKHKGLCGNDIDLRYGYKEEDYPGGVTPSITPFAGGAGNPDPIDVIGAWGNDRYHLIAWPWTDVASLDALRDELASRWGPIRQIDGHAVIVKRGTYSDVITFCESRNDKCLTVFPSEGSPTSPWVDAAASVAVIAIAADDDPVRPFQTLVIPGVLAPAKKDRWSDFPEKNQSLFSGCAARGVTPDGRVMFLNVTTTYRLNEWGAETQAFVQANTGFTVSFLRYDWNNYMQTKYPRYKLASDSAAKKLNPGEPVMTPSLGKAEAVSRMQEWVRRGLVEAPEDFKEKLSVEIDATNPNRLNFMMSPDLVNQFRVCGTLIRFLL